MPYVDSAYYTSSYYGEPIPADDFARYDARAEETVDLLTRYKINEIGLDNLPALSRSLVKKAVCAQIEFLAFNGIEADQSTTESFTVGKVSVRGGNTEKVKTVSDKCISFLEASGLLERAVPCGCYA